jgi:hypothetical protein
MRAGGEVYLSIRLVKAMSSKKKKKKKRIKTAMVVSRNGKCFWTTQTQFWQWVRERIVVKVGDNPLHGEFVREHEESFVVLSNTILNLAYPNHLCESLASRKLASLRS